MQVVREWKVERLASRLKTGGRPPDLPQHRMDGQRARDSVVWDAT